MRAGIDARVILILPEKICDEHALKIELLVEQELNKIGVIRVSPETKPFPIGFRIHFLGVERRYSLFLKAPDAMPDFEDECVATSPFDAAVKFRAKHPKEFSGLSDKDLVDRIEEM